MRARHWLLGTVVVATCLVGPAAAEQAVQWQPTLETAKRVAAQTNRLLLIHFWGEGCPPCKWMEREVYTRPEVAEAMQRGFVAVKVNQSYFPSTAAQFGVSAVPTDVILTARGQLLERHVGATSASQYVARLDRIAANWRRSGRQSAQFASGTPRSEQPESVLVGPRYSSDPIADSRSPRPEADRSWQMPPSGTTLPSQPSVSPYSPQFAENTTIARTTAPGTRTDYGRRDPIVTAPTAVGPAESFRASVPPSPPENFAPPLAPPRSPPPSPQPNTIAQTAPAIELPPGNPPLSLDGYCPVQLSEKKRWVLGNTRWGLRYEGRTYLFAGPEEQKRFNERPDDFAPAAAGNDVVLLAETGQTVAGRREHGAWFLGRVYLFASEDSFTRFEASPERYVDSSHQPVRNTANRFAPPAETPPWATSRRATPAPY